MPTFGQLKTKISSKSETNFLLDQVGEAINDAVAYYSNIEFWFNEAQATLTCTVNTSLLSTGLPSDFYSFRDDNGLVLINGQLKYPLKKISGLEFDMMDAQSIGQPRFFVYRNGNIYLYPYPDQAYVVQLNYTKSYAEMTQDSDSNDFTNYADRLIQAKALSDLYLDYRHSPTDSAEYRREADDLLKQILNQSTKRSPTGYLTTENILDGGLYETSSWWSIYRRL